jgi:septal ring factor EnvC (AmiA/AmiB activator)|tara:strand:+ start:355 stop:594 length:240 start_codon:yes stop_codon:yes gene_type:complete
MKDSKTMKKEDIKQISTTFRQQQHQIDMLVAIINDFTKESATLAKSMEHIVRRLDNIEKFLDQINREVGEDHDENRIVN